jgi:hypothetical protein
MGFMDKLKGWLGGNKQQVDQGIDKTADAVKAKVPDQHDAKVDQAAEKAKDAVDKLAGDAGEPDTPADTAAAPPAASPVTPPVAPPGEPATGGPA